MDITENHYLVFEHFLKYHTKNNEVLLQDKDTNQVLQQEHMEDCFDHYFYPVGMDNDKVYLLGVHKELDYLSLCIVYRNKNMASLSLVNKDKLPYMGKY